MFKRFPLTRYPKTIMSSTTPMRGLQQDGWFREESVMWPGQAMSLKVGKVEYSAQTKFQDLAVFENEGPWGTVLTLDGAIQITDKDEFVYHEMMAHVPLYAHPKPEKVLIIGGGDGGVMREVIKHPSVVSCDLVDIDGDVIEQSKKFFPQVAESFASPKTNTMVGDGAAFIATKTAEYDVIIVHSSDPEGPASALFGQEFYTNVKKALRPGGIVCSQGENLWIHQGIIEKMMNFLKGDIQFTTVKYGMIYIPTYPCGSIGCLISSLGDHDVSTPLRNVEDDAFAANLKYYDTSIHKGAFALPRFGAHLNKN